MLTRSPWLLYSRSIFDVLTTTIDGQGRIRIPSSARKQLGLEAGTELLVLVEDGMLRLLTRDAGVAQAQRLVADALGESCHTLVDELISDRRLRPSR